MVRSRWIGAVAGVLTCLAPSAFAQPMLAPNQIFNVREGDKPARKCKVLKVTTVRDGSRVCELEALDNGEKMTIVEPPAGMGGPRLVTGSRLTNLFGGKGSKPAPQPTPTSAPPLAEKAPAVAVPTAPPRPTNWRESWGKVERWKEADSKAAADIATQRSPTFGRLSIPVAKGDNAEPLSAPERFTKMELPAAVTPLPGPVVSTTTPAVPVVQAPAPTPAVTPAPPSTPPTTVVTTSVPSAPVVKAPLTPPNLGSAPAPASAPVTALPVSVKTTTPGRSWLSGRFPVRSAGEKAVTVTEEQGAPTLAPTAAKSRFGQASVFAAVEEVRPVKGKMPSMDNAMSVQTGPAYVDPKGGANAFSAGVPSRPIPSDMGMAGPPAGYAPRPGMMAGSFMPPLPPQPLTPAMRQQMMMAAMAQQQQAAMMQMAMVQQQQMAMAAQQVAPARPASHTPKLLADLRDSILPSEREMAVDRLRHVNWKAEPEVLQGLTEAAKVDPSPAVRLACVRALGHMKADTFPVVQTLETLKQDSDPRIRQESQAVSERLSVKK